MRTVFVRMTPEILTLYPASVSAEIGVSADPGPASGGPAAALISTAHLRFWYLFLFDHARHSGHTSPSDSGATTSCASLNS
ncbi:MAG TPA: hypothetical protein VN282_08570 [Pyrinomonadaceae bacterium]|nr:hypothetical protein [Pyrinomonadaceae bacterium]